MSIGQDLLLREYHSPFKLAIALIKGELEDCDVACAMTMITEPLVLAAKAHLELGFNKTKK